MARPIIAVVASRGLSAVPRYQMSLFFHYSCKAPFSPQPTLPPKTMSHLPVAGFNYASNGLVARREVLDLRTQWSFINGSRFVLRPKVSRIIYHRRGFSPSALCAGFYVHVYMRPLYHEFAACCMMRTNLCGFCSFKKHDSKAGITSSQIANCAFTWGTVAVLPFYALMVLAPNARLTRRMMDSSAPYVILGVLYAYLLSLSWTPDTLRMMFASKYWLPELPGIAKMFANEMTLASAWIHLLAVDLFAARQVFDDGLKNKVETRHSVSLCLFFCPIGIATHAITKVLTKMSTQSH